MLQCYMEICSDIFTECIHCMPFFSGVIVEHIYVKFGDPSCIGF